MNEQKNNGRGIFYGVIGVATLVVAIIGATFAYFTATQSNNVMTGNMASIKLNLDVQKVTTVDETKGGMIPMSNGMVEQAINKAENEVCVDDNGNAVCQIYKITLTNDSSAAQFVDGYVALRGGSGIPTDLPTGVTYEAGAMVDAVKTTTTYGTTMRWAQVFKNGEKYSTAGDQELNVGGTSVKASYTAIGQTGALADQDAHNKDHILYAYGPAAAQTGAVAGGTLKKEILAGSPYDVLAQNYIRISNHVWATDGAESYDRTKDITSALILNQNLGATQNTEYYFVVWLSETGTNQTAGTTVGDGNDSITNPGVASFFAGNVTFVSAQGSEVSGTFSGFAKVTSGAATNVEEP